MYVCIILLWAHIGTTTYILRPSIPCPYVDVGTYVDVNVAIVRARFCASVDAVGSYVHMRCARKILRCACQLFRGAGRDRITSLPGLPVIASIRH